MSTPPKLQKSMAHFTFYYGQARQFTDLCGKSFIAAERISTGQIPFLMPNQEHRGTKCRYFILL